MIPAERQQKILNLIQRQNFASISELTELLNVSHMTIRRDIEALEKEGKAASILGGVRILEYLTTEPSHDSKSLQYQEQKRKIAQATMNYIPKHSTIYLDAGTTVLEIAKCIADRSDLLVITNDFITANFLMRYSKCEIIHTGGSIHKSNYSSIGELTAQFFTKVNIDTAIISTSSWNIEGHSTPEQNKVAVKQAAMKVSTQSILVSDSSKFGKIATYSISPLSYFKYIICDSNLPEHAKNALKKIDANLVIA